MVWIWIDLDSFETEETKVKSNDESAIGVYQVYHWVYFYLGWSTEVADDDRSLRGLGLWSTPLINSKKNRGHIFRSYQVLSKTSWFDMIFGRPRILKQKKVPVLRTFPIFLWGLWENFETSLMVMIEIVLSSAMRNCVALWQASIGRIHGAIIL